MSIFASQFNQVSPYEPVGLDTGTPSIGVTLGKKTPKRPPAEEPSNIRPGNPGEAPAEASAAQTGDNFAGAGASQLAAANKNNANVTAGLNSHMSAANQAANEIGFHPAPAPATHVVMPKHSGADATPPKQSGGFLGFIEHAGHDVNAIAHNPVVNRIMGFGDPFGDHGISGAVADQSQTNPTIKPTRVYNPQRPSAQGIESGKPGTVQGTVEGNPAVDVAAPQALPRAYTSQESFADMMRGSGMTDYGAPVNPTQFGGVARSVPWYDELGSVGEDLVGAL